MTFNEHLIAGLSAAWGCSVGEVEKRVAAKRKRTAKAQPEDVAWTAARCQRLLRTITSRISILQKQHKLGQADHHGGTAASTAGASNNTGKTTAPRTEDPDWLPDVMPKKSTQTYGRRAKKATGEVRRNVRMAEKQSSFSTPFVKKLLDPTSTGPSTVKRPKLIAQHSSHEDSKPKRQLPIQSSSSNEEAQKNLVRAFSTLLATTAAPTPSSRTGAPSLLSSCLRKVPNYIELEIEAIEEEEDVASEDVTSSLYAELESLGTRSDGGWPALREAVRAHAFHHVCGAIEDGLVPDNRTSELVTACNREGSVLESQKLLQSWSRRPQSKRSSNMRMDGTAIYKLTDLREMHDASDLYFRTCGAIIESSQLCVNEVMRTDSPLLSALVKALVRGPGTLAAGTCFETVVAKAHELDTHLENAAVGRVFDKLAGLLASVAIARSSSSAGSGPEPLAALIRRITVRLMQCRAVTAATNSRPVSNKPHLMLFASLLLNLACQPVDDSVVAPDLTGLVSSMTAATANGQKLRDDFVRFVCTAAIHVSRFTNSTVVETFQLVTRGLKTDTSALQESFDCDSEALRRLGLEIAIAFTERTGTPVDQDLVGGQSFHRSEHGGKHPIGNESKSPVSGFKWEDGLCEWIAATPAIRKSEKREDPVDDLDKPESKPHLPLTREQDVLPASTSPSLDVRGSQTPVKHYPEPGPSVLSPDVLALDPTNPRPPLGERAVNLSFRATDLRPGDCEGSTPPASSEPKRKKPFRRKSLKRLRSSLDLEQENAQPPAWSHEDEADELGMPTPASKRRKPLGLLTGNRQYIPSKKKEKAAAWDRKPQRFSSSNRLAGGGEGSEDELGL